MSAFQFQLQGFTPAFRDAEVEITHQATGATLRRKPFLDGSLVMRDLEPGLWDMRVVHPNLLTPIFEKPVRLFPQPMPTIVPVPVPADLFRDTPIRDVPDADLGPVQAEATAIRGRVERTGGKAPGEVIRASDWNALAAAVGDLAGAVAQLSRLVSPRGHDHPEIAEKIDEVQGNIRRFAEAFGRSLIELRREVEAAKISQNTRKTLDLGQAPIEIRDRVEGRLREIEEATQAETPVFTGKLAAFGSAVLSDINELAQSKGADADDFLKTPEVAQLTAMAGRYSTAGTQTRPEAELLTYQMTGSEIRGSKFGSLLRG